MSDNAASIFRSKYFDWTYDRLIKYFHVIQWLNSHRNAFTKLTLSILCVCVGNVLILWLHSERQRTHQPTIQRYTHTYITIINRHLLYYWCNAFTAYAMILLHGIMMRLWHIYIIICYNRLAYDEKGFRLLCQWAISFSPFKCNSIENISRAYFPINLSHLIGVSIF